MKEITISPCGDHRNCYVCINNEECMKDIKIKEIIDKKGDQLFQLIVEILGECERYKSDKKGYSLFTIERIIKLIEKFNKKEN